MHLNTGFLLLSASAILALSSCGKVNDMHDATMALKDKTDHVDATTCALYVSERQKGSADIRNTELGSLKTSSNINEKLETAAKYMQAFEFQVYSSVCEQYISRDAVIDQAMSELLTTLEPFVKDRSEVTATKQSSDYQTLYALAATLHRTNNLQKGLSQTGEAPLRPFDIIVRGLKLNQQRNLGQLSEDATPAWATTIGKYEKDAEFVLRLRANFMMAYGYAVADSDSYGNAPNTFEKIWRLATTKIFSKKWTPDLVDRDPTEIRERITVSLRLAKETRDALTSLGIDPMPDQTVMKLWKDADFSSFDLVSMAKGPNFEPARAKAIQDLISARDALISE
jgi:hypothetical protein